MLENEVETESVNKCKYKVLINSSRTLYSNGQNAKR